MSATFDGTGGTFLFANAIATFGSSPCWVGAWVSMDRQFRWDTEYAVIATEKSGDANSQRLTVSGRAPNAITQTSAGTRTASAQEGVIGQPYWDHVLMEVTATGVRKIHINGVFEGSENTAAAPVFPAGAQTRIGIRADGTKPFRGRIADVVIGSSTLSDGDRANLATLGYNFATVPGAAHWYPLLANGNDSIGGVNLTASGTVVFGTQPAAVVPPTSSVDYCQQVFKQPTLPTDLPVVTVGTSPLANVTGYSAVQQLAISFPTGIASPATYVTRLWLYQSSAPSKNHVVFFDDGHDPLTVIDLIENPPMGNGSGGSALISTLLANGYDVLFSLPPGFNPNDSFFATQPFNGHDYMWPLVSPTFNPLQFWFRPVVTAMNYLAPLYPKRSVTGLSGGSWQAFRFAALDPRMNQAAIVNRGILAHRRLLEEGDFEQQPFANGWDNEDLMALAATNRRLWFINHPYDFCCFGKSVAGGGGAYLDAADYDAKFLDPARRRVPTDLLFIEDGGQPYHMVTVWATNNVILPALSTPLALPPADGGGNVVLPLVDGMSMRAGGLTKKPFAGRDYLAQRGNGPISHTWDMHFTDHEGRVYTNTTRPPILTAFPAAGTNPVFTVVGTDDAGMVSLTAGSGSTAGAAVFTIHFSMPRTRAPWSVTLTPGNFLAAGNVVATSFFVGNVGADSFAVSSFGSALVGGQPYVWYYKVNG